MPRVPRTRRSKRTARVSICVGSKHEALHRHIFNRFKSSASVNCLDNEENGQEQQSGRVWNELEGQDLSASFAVCACRFGIRSLLQLHNALIALFSALCMLIFEFESLQRMLHALVQEMRRGR